MLVTPGVKGLKKLSIILHDDSLRGNYHNFSRAKLPRS